MPPQELPESSDSDDFVVVERPASPKIDDWEIVTRPRPVRYLPCCGRNGNDEGLSSIPENQPAPVVIGEANL